MKAETFVEDDQLDDLDDDGDREPHTMVIAQVFTPDGMKYGAAVHMVGDVQPAHVAEALVSCVHGAARTHSPEAAEVLARMVRYDENGDQL